ncbi:MAG: HAD family hydrolase [Anaerolinea sp.]|nr:HAD family hydrolase [Anaerolinea sp.]
MTITHLFFDLHGVLIDPRRNSQCWSAALGRFMAERFGGTPAAWERANHQIEEDWDSYYADLDFGGDDCVEQMWEGVFRTTRAQFRLTGTPEPPHDALIALSREIPGTIPRACASAYPEVAAVLARLVAGGITLSVTSHALETQVRATLEGSGLLDYFGAVIGTDTFGRFHKDAAYYTRAAQHLKVDPRRCAVLDDRPEPVEGAKLAGMETIFVCRPERCHDRRTSADLVVPDLTPLPAKYAPD